MSEQKSSPVSIFYSYAHEDEALRDELNKHLSVLRRQGFIVEWYDRQVVAGVDWAQEIDTHLTTASIILLLISPDFLASDYCYGIEMQQAMELHAANKAHVVPVLLRPVDWKGLFFEKLQCLPRNAKPVTIWSNQDEAFFDISTNIRTYVEQMVRIRDEVDNIDQSQIPSILPQKTPIHVRDPFPFEDIFDRFKTQYEQKILLWYPPQSLIWKVDAFWIKNVLEQSLHYKAFVTLELQKRPDAVISPWRLVIQESENITHPLAPHTRITQVYDDAAGELLILGEPGAGKTTLLLELARDLLKRAQDDHDHLIPVVFNLASWGEKRQPIYNWLIEELKSRYSVSERIGSVWIKYDRILPLLDGLDEVASAYQIACIHAINMYHQEHGLVPIVICCRNNNYLAQKRRLQLSCAVVIQPLTPNQVDEYLSHSGKQLVNARTMLKEDKKLYSIITTPLMLNILMLAYQEKSFDSISNNQSISIESRKIFETYTNHMLRRRGVSNRYTTDQTLHRLVWLATQLSYHNQKEFSIEAMRLDWLPDGRSRSIYHVIAVFIFVSLFIPLDVLGGIQVHHEFGLSSLIGAALGCTVGMIYGLSFGMTYKQGKGILFDGIAFIQQTILRFALWYNGYLPWNYHRFLDYGVERLLLHRVGRNYIFIHQLLLDYLVSLNTHPPDKEAP